jgi:hypothetical protein
MARPNPKPKPASDSPPFEYPTPTLIDAYRNGTASLAGGTQTPLYAPQMPPTSNLGAPSAAAPFGRRLMQAVAIRILGADAGSVLFPPQQPLQPVAQAPAFGAVGRPWDYPVGYNTRVTPRTGLRIGFPFLKAMAEFDLVRIMIERVKEELGTMAWTIGPRDKKQARDSDMDAIEDMLAYPDKVHTWRDWTFQLMEQVLVYDAPALWLRPTRGGDLFSLEIMDGSMFTPKIMADGRLPPPEFGPAYQQVLKGLPAIDYIQPVPKGQPVPVDGFGEPFPELLYKPRNPRIDLPYGFGPIEQIIRTLEIGILREDFLKDYYTAGSIPDMFAFAPDTWNPDQIAQMQLLFDSVNLGNLANRRGVRWLPGGGKPPYEPRKDALTDATDEWLIRVMCFAFGLSPMPFVKMMNRASGQTHAEQQKEEGTLPYASYLADLMNHVIMLKFGRRDIVFRWEEEVATDPLEEAQRFALYLTNKVYHPDEVRQKLGDDAMTPELRAQMDQPTVSNGVNATVLPPDQQAEADQRNEDKMKAQAAMAPKPGAPGAPAPGVAGKMGKGVRKYGRNSTLSGLRY